MDNLTAAAALQQFHNDNGFGIDGGIHEPIVWIKVWFFSIPFPNFESRKKIVHFHDLNHIITRNGTTWREEASVCAWEIASGGWRSNLTAWSLTVTTVAVGAVLYPKNTYDSFQRGLTMNNTMISGISKEELTTTTISDLRARLSNQPKRDKNGYFWLAFCAFLTFAPFLILPFLILYIL